MRRIVLGEDRRGHAKDDGKREAGGQVTLVFPETGTEYEQARTEVRTLARAPRRTNRGRRRNGAAQLNGPVATKQTPAAGCYIVTTDKQRRAWGLPDLTAAGDDSDPAEPGARGGRTSVPVVDPADAVPILLGNDPQRSDCRGDRANAGGRRAQLGHSRQMRPDAPTVNLKQNRGPVPADLRATFDALWQQPRIQGLLKSIDAVIEPLECSVAPDLQAEAADAATLRQQVFVPEPSSAPSGGDTEDDAERTARLCWTVARRLRKTCRAFGRIGFSRMPDVKSVPFEFRKFLDGTADAHPFGAADPATVKAECEQALLGSERAAEQVLERIRDLVDAHREVAPSDWNDAAMERIGRVINRLDDVGEVLDDGTLSDEQVSAMRNGLEEFRKERLSPGRLADAFEDVLERVEAADLPVPVPARALDELRLSLTASEGAAGIGTLR